MFSVIVTPWTKPSKAGVTMNKTYKIDKDSVKRLAHNRWFELFNALIPEQG